MFSLPIGIYDDLWYPKCDRHTMEHPFFSLSKKKDVRPRFYQSPNGQVHVVVTPSILGLPTIWDKDLLIYVATLIRGAMNKGRLGPENRPIPISSHNFLTATGKGDGMQQYHGLISTLDRLKSCMVKTSIQTNSVIFTESFSLLDNYKVAACTKSGKISVLEIKVCDWLYGAIWNDKSEMLSVHKDYFKLNGGIERRLYELSRKHCGRQPFWKVNIKTLWEKSGSTATLKKFRHMLFKGQADLGTLPEYRVELLPEKDQVIFYSVNFKRPLLALMRSHLLPVDSTVY